MKRNKKDFIRKIACEIFIVLGCWMLLTIYGYFETPFKEDSWWISAITIIVLYIIFELVERKNKKKNK